MKDFDAALVMESPCVEDCISDLIWALMEGERASIVTPAINLRHAVADRVSELRDAPEPALVLDELEQYKNHRDRNL